MNEFPLIISDTHKCEPPWIEKNENNKYVFIVINDATQWQNGSFSFYSGSCVVFMCITAVTTTVMLPSLRDLPAQTMCPHCKHQVITITDHYSGLMAWLACGCLALIGCWPCCLAPFWMDSCKDVEHRCPNCNNILSFYKRL
uniref:Lipopolysaccharide-induced tumor necrosis factor-alpha factor homolog n=1 Tax=Sinocyclocheilus rhinocerous TaxID=307959 RepID=A0A673JL11_9TELE